MKTSAKPSSTPARARTVQELLQSFRLKAETRALLPRLYQLAPRSAFELLLSERIYADAIRLLAITLPKPAAVWWGTLCAWDLYRRPHSELEPASDVAEEALAASYDWLRFPCEVTRRAAERAGRAAKAKTPAGALSLAAAWSDGSLAPVGLPAVLPPWYLTGKLTAGAVLLCAACKRPYALYENYCLYLHLGQQVAAGKLLWPPLTASERAIVEEHRDDVALRRPLRGATERRLAAARAHFADPAQQTPPAPHVQTTLLTAREQLATQLQALDEMIASGQYA